MKRCSESMGLVSCVLGLVLFSNQVASTCFMALNTFHALPLQMFCCWWDQHITDP